MYTNGDQNNQIVQPLVAGENDQNVKSKADGRKTAKSPGKDKKHRAKKRLKTEGTERQLEETRSEIDELKKKIAYLNGKVDQAKEDMELITGARHRVLIRPRAEPRKNATPVAGTTGCSMFWPLGGLGLDLRESLCPSHEVERAHPVAGTTGCSMFQPLGGLDLRESLCPSHEVERAHLSMPSTSILENLSMLSTPILENLSMLSTPILENLSMPSTPILENDWIEDQYNAPTRMS
ncbi:hypothetical protein OIU76_006091 [Salix suchowensis]|nr:hypothetical protein OIU76_006091 [Salix suchowensis]